MSCLANMKKCHFDREKSDSRRQYSSQWNKTLTRTVVLLTAKQSCADLHFQKNLNFLFWNTGIYVTAKTFLWRVCRLMFLFWCKLRAVLPSSLIMSRLLEQFLTLIENEIWNFCRKISNIYKLSGITLLTFEAVEMRSLRSRVIRICFSASRAAARRRWLSARASSRLLKNASNVEKSSCELIVFGFSPK